MSLEDYESKDLHTYIFDTPDTYEGAPLTIGALLSAGTKKAGFIVALRLFFIAFPLIAIYQSWTVAFAVLAVLTMILGNFAALLAVIQNVR